MKKKKQRKKEDDNKKGLKEGGDEGEGEGCDKEKHKMIKTRNMKTNKQTNRQRIVKINTRIKKIL